MSIVPLSGLAHQPTYSRLSAKESHEFSLGGGLVLTNRANRPRILENFPFCVRFDSSKKSKNLKSNILQTTLFDYDIAAFADMGFLDPQYLTINDELQVLTFRAALKARIPVGFTVMDDILVFCDSFSRVIIPTFDAVMYMIAIDESMPESLRIKAFNSYCSAPERNIFRSYTPHSDATQMALLGVRSLAGQQDTERGDYTPQSGSLSSCAQAKGAVQTCASDVVATATQAVVPFLDQFGLPSDPMLLVVHLLTFSKPLISVLVYLLLYVLVRLFVDICVTLRFAAGCLVGFLLPRPPKKPVSLFDSLFVPQAAMFDSDDGAAFKGTQEKKKNTHSGASVPASGSAPGMTATPTLGFAQPVRTAPPKPTKKDPNDGPLNGFGVGI